MRVTHEVVDIDTGKVICTLPIEGGGQLPRYRAYIRPIDSHDWECVDPGMYDSIYKCRKCGKTVCESVDDPGSSLPVLGCS